MALEKNFRNVVTQKEDNKQRITTLTELDENDKNTIYNLIFKDTRTQIGQEQ